jgi:YD repeat-containing protein
MKLQKRTTLNCLAASAIALAASSAYADGPQITTVKTNITTTTTVYDADATLTTTVDPIGNTTTLVYDADGDRSSTATSNTTTYSYDADDRATTPNNLTTYTYDAEGSDSTSTTTGGTTSATYDQPGNSQTDSDALGNTTRYQYDTGTGAGQTTETDPLGRVTTYQYDPEQGSTGVSGADPLGNTTSYTYDAASRQIQNTDSLGGATTANPDTNATGSEDFTVPTRYEYDAIGTIQTNDAGSTYDVSLEDVTLGLTIFTYDATTPDALGRTTTYQYDPVDGVNDGTLTGSLEGDLTPGDVYRYQYSYDINQDPSVNQIGTGTGSNALTLTQLPEPGSAGLLLISATTYLSRRRRTRNPGWKAN